MKRLLEGFALCLGASALVHGATAGGLLYWAFQRQPPPIVAELDLSMSPLSVPNPGGGAAPRPSKAWTLPKRGLPPLPAPKPAAAPPPPEPAASVDSKPSTAAGQGDGGGGNGQGQGAYVPASQTARQPRWLSNFITSYDYPRLARQEGKDGRVVLSVLLDRDGAVRDARLLQGSYAALNDVALRKIKEAVFSPAYDAKGRPVACKVTIPIRFELR